MVWLSLDKNLNQSLTRQLYLQIREQILSGELKRLEKLPSTRLLASELSVSRNVVLEVYEQLLAEGYIEARQGAGTFVAGGACLDKGEKINTVPALLPGKALQAQEDIVDFRPGVPGLDLFNSKKWAKLAQRVYQEATPSLFDYQPPEGMAKLREVLASYLQRSRGINCQADQIIITTGATQAFVLLAQLFLEAEDEIIMEDPTSLHFPAIFSGRGAKLNFIPVDDEGVITELLPQEKKPKLIFVTPSHQFPLGGVLPVQRRIQLISYARERDCYIVEDDYDSEFRFSGAPLSSLQELDPPRVFYVGTFSKALFPALRMGYIILPEPFIQKSREIKRFHDIHTPAVEQLILANYIEEGMLERQIRRAKKIYRQRRDTLIQSLTHAFDDSVSFLGTSTGLHMVVVFKHMPFDENLPGRLADAGVKLYPVEMYSVKKGSHLGKIVMGFANLTPERIMEGVRRMQGVIGGKA